MKFSFFIDDWYALAPGLDCNEAWYAWAEQESICIQTDEPLIKCKHMPMMQARRLMSGCRYAVECGLELWGRNTSVNAVVFSSQHSELERNFNILQAIVQDSEVSPTDFAMSVHNAAAGTLSIIAKTHVPMSAVSAGADTFLQALVEVQTLFAKGYDRVLLVDFDGNIPGYYKKYLGEVRFPYVAGFVLTPDKQWLCNTKDTKIQRAEVQQVHTETSAKDGDVFIPDSLKFLHLILRREETFTLIGMRQLWCWEKVPGL